MHRARTRYWNHRAKSLPVGRRSRMRNGLPAMQRHIVHDMIASAEHQCPVTLLVVCPHARVARWARKPISFGTGATLVSTVLGPDQLPMAPLPPQPNPLELLLAVLGTAMHAADPAALQHVRRLGEDVLNTRPSARMSATVCLKLCLETSFLPPWRPSWAQTAGTIAARCFAK